MEDGSLRIYIQCRDERNVGRIGYVDVDSNNPLHVVRVAQKPVLDIGVAGAFDDNGVFQTSIVRNGDGRLFMYYVGFELCHHIRYRLLTGLAISEDGGESFQRIGRTPILERSSEELHFRCGPFVLGEDKRYRMWYVGGSSWVEIEGKQMPVYDIRYIESGDGIHWPTHGRVVLPISRQDEHGFGRPYVLHEAGLYRMFYSIRKKSPLRYCVGYAESLDGIDWVRMDERAGLDVSLSGWDSESVEYAARVKTSGFTWLLYNGNDFGATGFGVARLEAD